MTAPPRLLALQGALPPELTRALNGAPGEPTAQDLAALADALGGALGVALPLPVVAKGLPATAKAALGGSAAAGSGSVGVLATKPLVIFGAWLVGGLALGAGLSVLTSSFVSTDGPAPPGRPTVSIALRRPPREARAVQAEAPVMLPDGPRAFPSAQPSHDTQALESETAAAREAELAPATQAAAPESELSLLKRARDAEPTRALALTAEHAQRFPAGALEQEREMIAIDALLQLGRRAEAAQRAKRFQSRYPGSAHTRRLNALFQSSTP